MPDDRSRTSLTPYAASMRDPDPNGAKRFAAKAWHENGMVVFMPESLARMPWEDRELVQRLAAKLYGKRDER
jgi:hypothetical protein